jgi:hypothetical protein
MRSCDDDIEVARMIAAALIPESPNAHEPFWVNGAQAVLGKTLWAMKLSAGESFKIADVVRGMGPVLEPEPTPEGER